MNADDAVGWSIGVLVVLGVLLLIAAPVYEARRRERARRRALDERLRVVLMTERSERGPTIIGKRVKIMEGGPKAPLVPRYDDDDPGSLDHVCHIPAGVGRCPVCGTKA